MPYVDLCRRKKVSTEEHVLLYECKERSIAGGMLCCYWFLTVVMIVFRNRVVCFSCSASGGCRNQTMRYHTETQ